MREGALGVVRMAQTTLLGWLKPKPKPKPEPKRPAPKWAYRFLMDFPEGIMTPKGPAGPFKAGDLVSENVMPAGVWAVLLKRGAVEPYQVRPEWPGPGGKGWA